MKIVIDSHSERKTVQKNFYNLDEQKLFKALIISIDYDKAKEVLSHCIPEFNSKKSVRELALGDLKRMYQILQNEFSY